MKHAANQGAAGLLNRATGIGAGLMSRGFMTASGVPKRVPNMCLGMRTSIAGCKFIFGIEVGPFKSKTAHLHWPGGASGVTLGPGYDMKDRSAAKIKADLMEIGVAESDADAAAEGAGLKGSDAEDFADDNSDLLSLTDDQQIALLKQIVGHYEAIVNRNIHIQLKQYEFDALVCFAYNPGGSFTSVARKVDADDMEAAAAIMKKRVISGGKAMKGLVNRRGKETNLLLHATY